MIANRFLPGRRDLLPLAGAAWLAAGCAVSDAPEAPDGPDAREAPGAPRAAAVSPAGIARAAAAGRDLLAGARGRLGIDADSDFVARAGVVVDGDGTSHVRYDQRYRGVRVWEGEAIVHARPGGADGAAGAELAGEITSELRGGIRIDTTPGLDADAALAIAARQLRPRGPYAAPPAAELVVFPHVREVVRAGGPSRPSGELDAVDLERVIDGYSLAYHVALAVEDGVTEPRHADYIIDAHTGAILKQWDSLQTAAALGTGNSEYSGVVTLNTNSIAGGYELRDVVSVMKYATYNANHGVGPLTIYTDPDNVWGDGVDYLPGGSTTSANGQTAAVDAHYGTGKWTAYFYNVFGRKGYDGLGTAISNRVHYGTRYSNVFWSDGCACMTYGDGDGTALRTPTSLDVVGHELTHGVTSHTANLTYVGESGGLNESMSDIHATMLEFYARGGTGSTIGYTGGTWTIGEQIMSPPLRYLYKPSLDGASPDAWYSGIGSIDVHYSSGPQNRMFYFLSQGASSTPGSVYYSPYRPCGMTGIGNDHAARIAYRALAVYMTASTNYAAARSAYLAAAADYYGTASADYAAVKNAFNAINVGAGATPCP